MNGIGRGPADRQYLYATFPLGGPTPEIEPRTGSLASVSPSIAAEILVKVMTTCLARNLVAEMSRIFLATCTVRLGARQGLRAQRVHSYNADTKERIAITSKACSPMDTKQRLYRERLLVLLSVC